MHPAACRVIPKWLLEGETGPLANHCSCPATCRNRPAQPPPTPSVIPKWLLEGKTDGSRDETYVPKA